MQNTTGTGPQTTQRGDRPKVFVSYAREDESVARAIYRALKEAGVEPWLDLEEVAWGDSFLERMNTGVGVASYVVLLVSPASMASRWVSREWMSALAGKGTVLLPALVADAEVPALLRDIAYIDLRTDLAAGLKRITAFFRREVSPPVVKELVTRDAEAAVHPLLRAPRRHIRLVAQSCMAEATFLAFLYDLEIDRGAVPGSSLHEKITYLLTDLSRAGASAEFVRWLVQEPDPLLRRCLQSRLAELQREASSSSP